MEATLEKYYQQAMDDIEPMLADSYRHWAICTWRRRNIRMQKEVLQKGTADLGKPGNIFSIRECTCFLNDEPHEGLNIIIFALSAGFDSDEMFFFMGMVYEHMNDDAMALRVHTESDCKESIPRTIR